MALTLSPQVFTILSALIEERCGLHYGERDRELLAHKVAPRAFEAGFESMLDYYYFLRYDAGGAAEIDRLVGLGAKRLDEHTEYGAHWITLADPEGNVFDVAEHA